MYDHYRTTWVKKIHTLKCTYKLTLTFVCPSLSHYVSGCQATVSCPPRSHPDPHWQAAGPPPVPLPFSKSLWWRPLSVPRAEPRSGSLPKKHLGWQVLRTWYHRQWSPDPVRGAAGSLGWTVQTASPAAAACLKKLLHEGPSHALNTPHVRVVWYLRA